MDQNLYTVAEYAARKSCSKQAVYKAVEDGRLISVEKVVNGRKIKLILERDLQLDSEPIQPERKEDSTMIQPAQIESEIKPDIQVENKVEQEFKKVEQLLIKEVEDLKVERDQLRMMLAEKDKTLEEYARRFADIAEKALMTTSNSQYLQAANMADQQIKTKEDPAASEEVIGDPVQPDHAEVQPSWIRRITDWIIGK